MQFLVSLLLSNILCAIPNSYLVDKVVLDVTLHLKPAHTASFCFNFFPLNVVLVCQKLNVENISES